MKCPECQHENPEGAKFCNECAHDLTLPSEPAPKELSFDEKIEKIQKYLPKGRDLKENNTMTAKYIYLTDNHGRRCGTERRRMFDFLGEEERRIGTDRRTYKDRRISIVDRRSNLKTSYESDRRSGQDRRGKSYTLFDLEEI